MVARVSTGPHAFGLPIERRFLDAIWISALRQLKARYRGSLFGILWSFANPILMTVLYTGLFGTAFATYYGGSVHQYVLSAFIGVVVVTFFTQTTTEALFAVVANGALLNKIAIDPEVFPIATIAANAFQQAVTTFPLLIILAVLTTHDPLRLIALPVVLVALTALVSGIGLILSALFVSYRDLSHVWGVFGFILWITSPVFYPAALVPERIRTWFYVNPLGLAISAVRDVSISRGAIDMPLLIRFTLVAVAVLLIGHALFRRQASIFMDSL